MKRFLEILCVFDALMTQNYPSLKKESITMIKKKLKVIVFCPPSVSLCLEKNCGEDYDCRIWVEFFFTGGEVVFFFRGGGRRGVYPQVP